MPVLLYVNACVRGAGVSRTDRICRAFLQELCAQRPGWEVEEVELAALDIRPFSAEMLARRDALLAAGALDAPELALARQFARADAVLVGAPYWDLSFPAVLKAYVEHISVCDITFCYAGDWLEGLCKAERLVYATSAGGPLEGVNYGYRYFEGLCRQFGIAQCGLLAVENLDIQGVDVPALLAAGEQEARRLARDWF